MCCVCVFVRSLIAIAVVVDDDDDVVVVIIKPVFGAIAALAFKRRSTKWEERIMNINESLR